MIDRPKGKIYPDSAVLVDRLGYGYVLVPEIMRDGGVMPMYVSPCCNAAISIDQDAVFYCKSCYEAVDPALGGEPVL